MCSTRLPPALLTLKRSTQVVPSLRGTFFNVSEIMPRSAQRPNSAAPNLAEKPGSKFSQAKKMVNEVKGRQTPAELELRMGSADALW